MDKFLASTSVTLEISLQDRLGNAIAPTAVEFEVLDRTGAVKQTRQAATYVAGGTTVPVTVTATANNLDDKVPRDLRTVKLYCTTVGGVVSISKSYAVEADSLLITGVNSFQTLEEAELTAMDIMEMGDWDLMDDDDKCRAMIDSRDRIVTMTFSMLDITRPQDSVSYVPEGIIGISKSGSIWNIRNQLADLTVEQFEALPEEFKVALRKAQVADAADTLTPDPVASRRASGLILDTIGETKQMFTSSRPIDTPISKRAMNYLSKFIASSVMKTGRAG